MGKKCGEESEFGWKQIVGFMVCMVLGLVGVWVGVYSEVR